MKSRRGRKSRKDRCAKTRARVGLTRRLTAGSSALVPEFLDETIAVWQPYSPQPLTREDAREIIHNVTGFFSILMEWEQAERRAAKRNKRPVHPEISRFPESDSQAQCWAVADDPQP